MRPYANFANPGFLSTLSLRRATRAEQSGNKVNHNFYPRSPCGERPPRLSRVVPTPIFLSTLSLRRATRHPEHQHKQKNFYPRSPCGERLTVPDLGKRDIRFLSTLSLRRATLRVVRSGNAKSISIHALLAESDYKIWHLWAIIIKFLSTLSLRRATLIPVTGRLKALLFLSTLSLRRATAEDISTRREASISIHALLAESDPGA